MSKSEITKKINELKKYNYKVIIFQTDRKKRRSESDMLDYLIIGHSRIYFLELKLKSTRDKTTEGQELLIKELKKCSYDNYGVNVAIINETNIDEIINKIFTKTKIS
jgi:hypothetical protein